MQRVKVAKMAKSPNLMVSHSVIRPGEAKTSLIYTLEAEKGRVTAKKKDESEYNR